MTIHLKSEIDLRQLAKDCLAQYADTDDAWATYRDEANARYAAEDDGDHAEYVEAATAIFNEAKIATVDLGDGDDTDTSNVIEHPAAAAKRQADERAARNAKYAERETAARKERSERRAELKRTKHLRDAKAEAEERRAKELREVGESIRDSFDDYVTTHGIRYDALEKVERKAKDAFDAEHGPNPENDNSLAAGTYWHNRNEAGDEAAHVLALAIARAQFVATKQAVADHFGFKTYDEYQADRERIEREEQEAWDMAHPEDAEDTEAVA